jgi:2-polyprenyl-6-methoxyphenol hydroxylase-like FAD-dependent oxidoreductase
MEWGVTEQTEAEVVVVGAGPTGLALAYELALAGIDVLVLERLSRRIEQVKGGALQPRTAELLESRGLLEPMLRRATAREAVGGHFAMLPVPLDCTPWQTRHPFPITVPQWEIEEVLEERAVAQGVRVLHGSTLTSLDGDGDGGGDSDGDGAGTDNGDRHGVTVVADGLRVRADYLVACDGARSTVRKLLGLPFPGRSGTYLAVLADIRLSAVSSLVPRQQGHISGLTRQAGGYWTLLIPLGEGRYRITFGRADQAGVERDTPVTEEEIAAALRTVYGEETVLSGVDNSSRFSDATRQLESYRTGRVLFAGDAAHIHPPLGGQGLNLGVQDAFNLGWKLAATLRGRAPAGLLDSYHRERHPAGAQVLHHTSAQRVLADPSASEDVTALRDIVTDLLRLPDTNRHIAGLMSGLSLRYEPADGQAHPLVGHRMPDMDLFTSEGPTRLSALFGTGHAVLLDLAGVVPGGLRLPASVDLVRATRPDGAGETRDPGAAALLFRPDGYVCWATDHPEDAAACQDGLLVAINASLTTA